MIRGSTENYQYCIGPVQQRGFGYTYFHFSRRPLATPGPPTPHGYARFIYGFHTIAGEHTTWLQSVYYRNDLRVRSWKVLSRMRTVQVRRHSDSGIGLLDWLSTAVAHAVAFFWFQARRTVTAWPWRVNYHLISDNVKSGQFEGASHTAK